MFPGRAEIQSAQLQKLNALGSALESANIFYTAKFRETGAPWKFTSLREFAERAPFTTKFELAADQKARPPYGSNLTYHLSRYTRCHQTSGTLGDPLRWLDTPESWDWMLRHWEQVYRAAGVTERDRVFCAFSFGPFIGFWLAFEAAARIGALTMPSGGLSSVARLRLILDHGITVLCATPTYALRLAEVAAEEGVDLASAPVRLLLVAGEPGGSVPAIRQRLERDWPRARVFDHHGMTEVGPVTFQCPAQPGVLHVMESGYLAEIVHPASGQACSPGQEGELVLTTLGRTGSPVVRYRTGDLVLAKSDSACVCGRGDLALQGGILGRTDDMVVVRGVNVYPGAVDAIVHSCAGVADFQVRVKESASLTELELDIELSPEGGDGVDVARRLAHLFETQLALRVPVTCKPAGSLPRSEMKSRRWIRE